MNFMFGRTVAKLVENDGNLLAVLLSENVVEKSSLSSAQIPRDNGDGYFAESCVV